MADGEIIPLIEDYNFSNLTDEELDRNILINQATLEQINRMIEVNQSEISLDHNVLGRTRLLNLLTAEKGFRTDEITALNAEKARRTGGEAL